MYSPMVSPNKRIKVFNKLLKEFLIDYKKIYNKEYRFKVKEIQFLNSFRDEVNYVKNDFINCNSSIFSNISLCKKFDLHTIDLDVNNVSIWKYLHNLYILTLQEDEKEQAMESSKKSLEKLENTDSNPDMNNMVEKLQHFISSDNEFGNLVKDVYDKISQSLKGKDLSKMNPLEVLQGFMSGDGNTGNVNGIDFGGIIKDTRDNLESKVQSGEIDPNLIKQQAESVMTKTFNQ